MSDVALSAYVAGQLRASLDDDYFLDLLPLLDSPQRLARYIAHLGQSQQRYPDPRLQAWGGYRHRRGALWAAVTYGLPPGVRTTLVCHAHSKRLARLQPRWGWLECLPLEAIWSWETNIGLHCPAGHEVQCNGNRLAADAVDAFRAGAKTVATRSGAAAP